MDCSSLVNSHEERNIVIWLTIFSIFLFMVHGLVGHIRGLRLGLDRVNGVKLLNLALLLVKIHNDGLVVSLADAVQKVVILGQQDSIDLADCVADIVEELTPHPVSKWTHSVNEAVRVLSWGKVA